MEEWKITFYDKDRQLFLLLYNFVYKMQGNRLRSLVASCSRISEFWRQWTLKQRSY